MPLPAQKASAWTLDSQGEIREILWLVTLQKKVLAKPPLCRNLWLLEEGEGKGGVLDLQGLVLTEPAVLSAPNGIELVRQFTSWLRGNSGLFKFWPGGAYPPGCKSWMALRTWGSRWP